MTSKDIFLEYHGEIDSDHSKEIDSSEWLHYFRNKQSSFLRDNSSRRLRYDMVLNIGGLVFATFLK